MAAEAAAEKIVAKYSRTTYPEFVHSTLSKSCPNVQKAVLYLSSPASGFTTGELLRVDGGLHLSNWWNKQAMLNEYGGATE